MNKPWQRKRGYDRLVETRSGPERILICCEGKKTEPNYFGKFPIDIELVEIDFDGGANTLALVNDALERKVSAEKKGQPYNQVWCVFDRDEFPPDHFNQAIKKATANQIHVAYSNPCFELWYYLHFHYIDVAIDRKKYGSKLSNCLKKKYEKNDNDMYSVLKDKQHMAINNAKKLKNSYFPCNPERDNPSTTVYLLVETLNKFL
ncbi:RloB domain-containing protein [candidate division KSB1 bacterium]|nr:RloB domain-containing protein [candidate division KSB1 bacterium]